MNRPKNPPLLQALRADAMEMGRVKAADRGAVGLVDVLMLPGFWSGALWRVANALHERGLRPLSRICYVINMVVFGADLGPGAVVGPGLVMPHPVGIAIASDVCFGARCRVMGLVRIGGSGKGGRVGHPVIGDDVWLLDGVKVFGPVHVGSRTVVGAATVVTQDLPPGMLVLPAKSSLELRIRPRTDLDDEPDSAETLVRGEPA